MRREVELGDRKVTVIGTAHVSSKSRDEVEQVIEEVGPDLVAVELDDNRLKSLRGEESWTELDIGEAIREGKGFLLFMNLILSIYQRQIGLEEDVKPGEEMLAAVNAAEDAGVNVALVDRDINETFKRALKELTLTEKLKLAASVFATADEVEPDELTEGDIVENMVMELEDEFPSLSRTFLDERNSYMAEKLLDEEFDHAVMVVGAAHVEGVIEELESGNGYEVMDRKSLPWYTVLKYGLPAFILVGIGYSFLKLGFGTGIEASAAWILINGVLAMLGAIVARSHPLTWVTSFVAAPLTSLDPALGAGMVAAYAESRFRPPTVGDLEEVSEISSYRELWSNHVGIILLTFIFVSIGSAAATFISAGYIASLISGI